MKSFVKEFIALVNGDGAEVLAQKALRKADSALKVQIAALKGDTVNFEDKVSEAQDRLASARVNGGKSLERDIYIRNLFDAKNAVTSADEALKVHNDKIAFLEAELKALDSDSE